jgi:hypothetical protein
VLALALAACGASQASAPAGTGPRAGAPSLGGSPGCAPSSARVLASDRYAEVYRLGDTVYGCSTSNGHRYRLGSAGFCTNADRVGPVALRGAVAAYGVQRCGVDTGTAQVVTRRLSDGRVLHTSPATSRVPGAESYQSVGSLVVKADGAVGWIGEAHSIIGKGSPVVEVRRFDAHGQAELDSGPAIAVRSLRLHGSRLSWLHSGAERSANLS